MSMLEAGPMKYKVPEFACAHKGCKGRVLCSVENAVIVGGDGLVFKCNVCGLLFNANGNKHIEDVHFLFLVDEKVAKEKVLPE